MDENFLFDPSINVLLKKPNPLDHLFYPQNIAIIGATEREESVGKVLLDNLRFTFTGEIFPVNPSRSDVFNIPAYKNVRSIPKPVDLAIIAIPAAKVKEAVLECAEKKIPTAIIISAGFKEQGKEGKKLEEEIAVIAKLSGMRIVGPNCLGVMNPHYAMNATFAKGMAQKGNIAFISQSGALGAAILDWSLKEKIGFSSFVSVGSMMDVSFGDLIDYFTYDPHTESILIYMESVGDSKKFLSAAKACALSKPIILIKAGVTEASAKAAASHTGALTGSDAVLDAALKRVGVLRVESLTDLFSMAEILKRSPKLKSPNLTIVTNAGGPAVIATDVLAKSGGQLSEISDETKKELSTFLPSAWSHSNPVDILGDASAELFSKTLKVLQKEKTSSATLVIVTPQHMTKPDEIAKSLLPYANEDRPILASWMGARSMERAVEILSEANISCFPLPDEACKSFSYMWKYSDNLSGLYETPTLYETISKEKEQSRKENVEKIFAKVQKENRTLLTEVESKEVFELFGIPTISTYIAKTKEEAVTYAKKIGYPVVLKVFSETVTHKKAVGGVVLNLKTDREVEEAFGKIKSAVGEHGTKEDFLGVTVQPMIALDEGYELILGSSCDSDFGPVVMFGLGGSLVEMVEDRALGLPPLTSTLAKRIMQETKIYQFLSKKQKNIDCNLLVKTFVRFSQLISNFPEIAESDLNPLFISEKGVLALDARIILHKENTKVPLAISPYPIQYIEEKTLANKTHIIFRPIRPEDEGEVLAFFEKESPKNFASFFEKTSVKTFMKKENLIRLCFSDYDREITFILAQREASTEKILGVARLSKLSSSEADFSLLVGKNFQKKGFGRFMLEQLLCVARKENIHFLFAKMHEDNFAMQAICAHLNFSLKKDREHHLICAELDLTKKN